MNTRPYRDMKSVRAVSVLEDLGKTSVYVLNTEQIKKYF
jgi:hypothetical protein